MCFIPENVKPTLETSKYPSWESVPQKQMHSAEEYASPTAFFVMAKNQTGKAKPEPFGQGMGTA